MSVFRRRLLAGIRKAQSNKHIYPSDWFGIGNDVELKHGEFLLFKGIKHNETDANWYLLDCHGDTITNSSNYYYFQPSDPSDILYILKDNVWVEIPKYSDNSIIGTQPTLSGICGSVGIFLPGTNRYITPIYFWWNMIEITDQVKKGTLSASKKYVATISSNSVIQIPVDVQNAYKGFVVQCRTILRCDGKQTRGEDGVITHRQGAWSAYASIASFTITAETEVGETKETFTRWMYKDRTRDATGTTFTEVRFSKTDSAGYVIDSDFRVFARPYE